MKTYLNQFRKTLRAGIAAIVLLLPYRSDANFLYVSNYGAESISKYDLATGERVLDFTSPSGLIGPVDVAVSGNFLFVSDSLADRVGKYNATTGLPVAGWTSPAELRGPFGLAIFGDTLYVADWYRSVVGAYDINTGTPIAGWTPPPASGGLYGPSGLAIWGDTLYVSAIGSNSVRAYNALTGVAVPGFNPITSIVNCHDVTVSGGNLYVTTSNRVRIFDAVTGEEKTGFNFPVAFNGPHGLASIENELFVAYYNNSTVRKYDGTTGADSGWAAGEGVGGPTGLAIQIIPEPGSAFLLSLGSVLFAILRRRKFSCYFGPKRTLGERNPNVVRCMIG